MFWGGLLSYAEPKKFWGGVKQNKKTNENPLFYWVFKSNTLPTTPHNSTQNQKTFQKFVFVHIIRTIFLRKIKIFKKNYKKYELLLDKIRTFIL